MSDKDQELVMGLPRVALGKFYKKSTERIGDIPPLQMINERDLQNFFTDCGDHISFRTRKEAETDPMWKQIIPYVMIQQDNIGANEDGPPFFAYRRTPKGGEDRLHGKRSIGIGGHINPHGHFGGLPLFQLGLYRELSEEVVIDSNWKYLTPVYLLNDDTDPVGQVHLGVVFLLRANGVKLNEADLADDGFYTIDELSKDIDNFESWSQGLIHMLVRKDDLRDFDDYVT